MVVSEYPEVIGGRQQLIAMDVLEPEEADEDSAVDDDGDALDEDDESGSGEAGVSTGVTEEVTKEVEEVQQAVKYDSLSYYMLKQTSLPTQGFKENNKAQDKLFKNICDFGEGT